MPHGSAIVVDVGKTVSKVSLWAADGTLIDRQTRTNGSPSADGLARLDVDAIGAWLVDALARHAGAPVEVIVPVAHGAAFAALRNGALAFAPLDYEAEPPASVLQGYRAARPHFAETGSPALPCGLNLGAQLHWLESLDPTTLAGTTLLPFAQYWAWFLSGSAHSEVTTLGCHSDLWSPAAGDWSTLARARGWSAQFAPLAHAGETVGTLRPELARRCGLPADARVLAGLHDSNAALHAARGFPAMEAAGATVLSTGTWFIAMSAAGAADAATRLPEQRDCLVNVDLAGQPVPSARWMGGREMALLCGEGQPPLDHGPDQQAMLDAVPGLLRAGSMALPSIMPGSGPFPDVQGRWLAEPTEAMPRRAAAALYAALMADAMLDLVAASGPVLVEGRFARCQVFIRALAALRAGQPVLPAAGDLDASFGALRLVDPTLRPAGDPSPAVSLPHDLSGYRRAWREQAGETLPEHHNGDRTIQ